MRRIHPPPAETVEPIQLLREEDRTPPPGRPWVMLNMVTSLDGRVQGPDGRSGPLSGAADRALFRALRATADVVLAGAGTARTENYGPVVLPDHLRRQRLTDGRPERPRLAVVTDSLELEPGSRLFGEQDRAERTLILTSRAAQQARPDATTALEEVATLVPAGDASLDWQLALSELAGHGPVLLVEGGPAVNAQLLARDLVDEICLTISPLVTGGTGMAMIENLAPTESPMHLARIAEEDGYLLLRYLRHPPAKSRRKI